MLDRHTVNWAIVLEVRPSGRSRGHCAPHGAHHHGPLSRVHARRARGLVVRVLGGLASVIDFGLSSSRVSPLATIDWSWSRAVPTSRR